MPSSPPRELPDSPERPARGAAPLALVRSPGAAELAPQLAARAALMRAVWCLGRTLFVGFWANLLDLALLAACVRWLELAPMPSRFIALTTSGLLTFVGNRSFVFRAQHGSVPKQASRFVIAELLALPLNMLSFRLCAEFAPLAAPELVSFVANALVFIAFAYPVRRLLVFTERVS